MENSRAKPERAVFSRIVVNTLNLAQELGAAGEKTTIVVQIVDVELKAACSDLVEQGARYRIPLLWHNLKRRSDPGRFVQIHQGRAEIPPRQLFDVMRHEDAALCAIRPEPHEGHSLQPLGLQREEQDPL